MKNKSSKRKSSSNRQAVPPVTREFTNKLYGPKNARTARKLRGYYENNKRLSHTVLVMVVLLACMVTLLVYRVMDSEEQVEKVDNFWLEGEINVDRIQNQILLKSFGESGVDGFQSIRLIGHMDLGEGPKEFYLLKKSPGLAFLKIKFSRQRSMAIGVNPDGVWRRFEMEGRDPIVESLNGEEAEGFRAIGHLFTPLMHQAVYRDSKINSIELSDDLGFQTIKVDYQNKFKNCNAVAYLDINDLVELEGIDYLADDTISRVTYSNYQAFDGVQVPMESVYYRDDVMVQQVSLEKVTVNTGVLTEVFSTPDH